MVWISNSELFVEQIGNNRLADATFGLDIGGSFTPFSVFVKSLSAFRLQDCIVKEMVLSEPDNVTMHILIRQHLEIHNGFLHMFSS